MISRKSCKKGEVVMFPVFTEREKDERPSGHDSVPAADGDPGRSKTEFVSVQTEEFKEPQTGISLTCDVTDKELRENIRKTGFLFAGDMINNLMAVIVVIYTVATFHQLAAYQSPKNWLILACECVIAAAYFVMPYCNMKQEKKRYRESGMGKVTIYPDRIELPESGRELPLDGTAELLRTEKAFTLVYPSEKKALIRTLCCVIIPRRCVPEKLLPDVEAMLTAGTRPKK
jgi:hypothetical protein